MPESIIGDTSIERRIKELIASNLNLGLTADDLPSERSLSDLGLTSGGIMMLVSLLEEEFDIEIEDHEFGPTHFSNVASIAQFVFVKVR